MKAKIISLRGNSGSGKSTISNMLIEKLSDFDVLYLEQDMFRRYINHAKKDDNFHDRRNELTILSICNMIEWAVDKFDVIILDGKFSARTYFPIYDFILSKQVELLPYWFELSFEETAARHSTREKAKVFDAEEMKKWWKPHDLLANVQEKIIDDKMTKEQILDKIVKDLGL